MHRKGLSLIEVMMALVILGIVVQIYFQTAKYSGQNQGKTRSWTAEAAVIEKTMESLRTDYSMTVLQSMNKSWIDSSQGTARIAVNVTGGQPSAAATTGFPAEMLAQMIVRASRVGETDTLSVTTILWVN
jgi:prepilin-type N-terminal cleavage/methylation domain-containing protein